MNPKPCGPLLIIIGGFKELTNGEISLEGDASLDDAVLEPPGDWSNGWGKLSSEQTKQLNITQFYNNNNIVIR